VQKDGEWKFPKGHLEKGENSKQAAIREVQEELCIDEENLFLMDKIGSVFYDFQMPENPGKHYKEVDYYIILTTQKLALKPEEGFDKAEWLSIEEAEKKLTFDNDRQIFKKAILMMGNYRPYYCCLEDVKTFLSKALKKDLVAIIPVGSLMWQQPVKGWTDIDIIIVVRNCSFHIKLLIGEILLKIYKKYRIKIGTNIISQEELKKPKCVALSLEGKTIQSLYALKQRLNKKEFDTFLLKNIGVIKLTNRKLITKIPALSIDELKKETQNNIKASFIITKLSLKYLKNCDSETSLDIITNAKKLFTSFPSKSLEEFAKIRNQWLKIKNRRKLLNILIKTDYLIEYISEYVFRKVKDE